MMKTTNPKNKEIFDYMIDQNVNILSRGKDIDPTCYSIIYNKKGDFSIFPIPLSTIGTPEMRLKMVGSMVDILKENKVKVDMFLLITTAFVFKKDTMEDKKECLIFSARDSLDNQRISMFSVNRKNGIVLKLIDDGSTSGWKTKDEMVKDKKGLEDSLLNSMWKDYRKIKKA